MTSIEDVKAVAAWFTEQQNNSAPLASQVLPNSSLQQSTACKSFMTVQILFLLTKVIIKKNKKILRHCSNCRC